MFDPSETKRSHRQKRPCTACAAAPVAAKVTLPDGRRVQICRPCAENSNAAELANAGRLFGEKLAIVVAREKSPCDVPLMCARLGAYLEIKQAFAAEGLFRVAGGASEVGALQEELCDGGAPPTAGELQRRGIDVHSCATVLKRYLKALPKPLLSAELFEEFVELATSFNDQGEGGPLATAKLRGLLRRLPRNNQRLLAFVLGLLKRCTANEASRMTPQSCAVCISPTILYPPPPDPK